MEIDKINDSALKEENRFHVCLADVPNLSASDMKEFLDYIPRKIIIPKINEIIDNKPNTEDTVSPEEFDNALSLKANADAVYTKTETDSLLLDKAGLNEVYLTDETYSKEEVDDLISNVRQLPSVTTFDNGKILRVADGKWTPVYIASAEEGEF